MKLNWGTTMPFPEKFLHNKRDTMGRYTGILKTVVKQIKSFIVKITDF